MIPEDSAFIFCTSCKLSFYLELITELENYPLPMTCPFCGDTGCLDDLEAHLDNADAALQAAMRRSKFALLRGGKPTGDPDAKA